MITPYFFSRDSVRDTVVRKNLKHGIHHVGPKDYAWAIKSTRIYTILSICKNMMDNGCSFEDAMAYCEKRVLGEGILAHYINYRFRHFYDFGLSKYGRMITDKMVAELLRWKQVHEGMYLDDIRKVMVVDLDSRAIRNTLNYLKIKNANCLLFADPNLDALKQGRLYIDNLCAEIQMPNDMKVNHIEKEFLRIVKIPTMKSLGGLRV